jgi:hypothetical protein
MNLILKDKFKGKDGLIYQASMKLKSMDDGSIYVWVNNGEDHYCVFRLTKNNADQLVEFVRCNIK